MSGPPATLVVSGERPDRTGVHIVYIFTALCGVLTGLALADFWHNRPPRPTRGTIADDWDTVHHVRIIGGDQ